MKVQSNPGGKSMASDLMRQLSGSSGARPTEKKNRLKEETVSVKFGPSHTYKKNNERKNCACLF